MFRRPKAIVLTAVAFYAIALAVAWRQVDMHARQRRDTMLESAERGYSAVIDGEIDAALRYVGGALLNAFGQKCRPQTLARMQELARYFNIDEINIVNGKGRVIGSNIPAVMDFDFNSHPLTREFMSLTNANTSIVSQPFRNGVANPDMFCKYYGMSFPDHDGFLQLGITVDRLRDTMYTYSEAEAEQILRDWHFSVVGWYERVLDGEDFAPGRIVRRRDADCGPVVGRQFDYRGYRYVALLPESYCYSQRNAAFAVTALVLGVLLFFFAYVLVRLAKASAKLEKLHADAASRTAADLALARTIQRAVLPSSRGAFADRLTFSLYAASVPAREVGGDFYDFYPMSDNRIGLLIADVSGKGIPAAMFATEAKNVIRQCTLEFPDLSEAVAQANARLCAENEAEMFVTAWIGALDCATGAIQYVNAGHNRPYVRTAAGEVTLVAGKGGFPLGMFGDAAYRVHRLALAPKDRLFLFTDGLTEAMNAQHELFGEKRLSAALLRNDVRSSIEQFVGSAEQSDDMTVLAVNWWGAASAETRTFPCDDRAPGAVIGFLRTALSPLEPKTRSRLLNAADEIVANIVGYSGSPDCTVSVETGGDRVRLTFSDAGCAYDPLTHEDPDTTAPLEERGIGGLGLVVVKKLVDRVIYRREAGRNVLQIIKATEGKSAL